MSDNVPRKARKAAQKTRTKAAVAVPHKVRRNASRPAKSRPGRYARPSSASKQGQLIAQLSAPTGATIGELTALTGWQAHTVRGAISGALRKRLGLQVICAKTAGGESRYRIETSDRA